MTALAVIEHIKKLPSRERRKVFAWVDHELTSKEDEFDRQAITEAKAEIAAGAKPRPFADVCKEIGI